MDNKIKIGLIIFLSIFFSSCVGWLENDSFYERPLNNWASIKYFSNQGYKGDVFNVSFSSRDTFLKDERIDVGVNSEYRRPMINDCISIMYNNDYILVQNKRNENDSSYLLIDSYYKITPTFSNDNITPNGYIIDTIAQAKYEELVNECKDCQELDADKIRQLDYELDHGGFPTKTVVFFTLIFIYIFYRIYKKKKAKKSSRK